MCWLEWAVCMQSVRVKLTVLKKLYDMTMKWQLIMTFIQNCIWCNAHIRCYHGDCEVWPRSWYIKNTEQTLENNQRQYNLQRVDDCQQINAASNCTMLWQLSPVSCCCCTCQQHEREREGERGGTWFCESYEKYSSLVQDSVKEKVFNGVTFLNFHLLEDHYTQN